MNTNKTRHGEMKMVATRYADTVYRMFCFVIGLSYSADVVHAARFGDVAVVDDAACDWRSRSAPRRRPNPIRPHSVCEHQNDYDGESGDEVVEG